jgi:hypothetical protein
MPQRCGWVRQEKAHDPHVSLSALLIGPRIGGVDQDRVRYSYGHVTSFFGCPPLNQLIPIRIFLDALLSNQHKKLKPIFGVGRLFLS